VVDKPIVVVGDPDAVEVSRADVVKIQGAMLWAEQNHMLVEWMTEFLYDIRHGDSIDLAIYQANWEWDL